MPFFSKTKQRFTLQTTNNNFFLNGKWKSNVNCNVLKLKGVHQKSQKIGVAAINTQHASHNMKQV